MATVFKRGGKKSKGKWYVEYLDHTGKRITKSARTTDKATAERIARKYEADAALRREGVIDPTLDAIGKESQRSIKDHLTDYENKLVAAKRNRKHVASTIKFIRWISEYAEFQTAADITADGVNRYARHLQDRGRAARTVQAHLTAIKSFTKWLSDNQKLPRNPLSSVRKPNPKTDRRRERRMLLPDEWLWLESSMQDGPDRYGMTARERLLLYRTAIQMGLRSNELRSLTRGRLNFDSKQPYITCKPGSTKNKKDARQYIHPELASGLEAHISRKAPKAPVFALPHASNVAPMLRDDLAEARKQWIQSAKDDPQEYSQREQSDFLADNNHEGEIFDFHCLRHTCGAWLAMAGEHPKVIQTIMRHANITLTMDTYGHLFPGQEADAVGRLREMMDSPRPEALRATGTDDQAAENLQQFLQQSGRETVQSSARRCESQRGRDGKKKTPKPLQIADLGEDVRDDATDDEGSQGTHRTPETQIIRPRFLRVLQRSQIRQAREPSSRRW